MNEPVAIIGMSCRFPGANSIDEFWQLLINGVDAISEIPPSRFSVEDYHSLTPGTPTKVSSREGGFLQDIDMFDAEFFGIPPREANLLDPQQRLLLEVAWEALEDAGQARERITGSRTGVFVGMWTNEYEDRIYASTDDIELYTTTGGGRYAASGRLSYFFNFHGPSLTLDTACSSSLVAVHLAVQSLRRGESTMALAGGVNLILTPDISIGYSRSGMLAPDGRCRFGDADAKGYVRSEGVGILVLKRLDEALADGDPIHAIIRGSAVNNDGRGSNLLVAPSSDMQAEMLRAAYHDAGVAPADVSYVEAHGTGTRVGDPAELTALGQVLGENRQSQETCLVGSVKTNIGHTEAAAGLAGMIKTILALKHRQVPPNLHFVTPTPAIDWTKLPFTIPRHTHIWTDQARTRYAGISAFGITGTNAHIVLESAPTQPQQLKSGDRALLVPLSAQSSQGLHHLAQAYRDWLPESDFHDLAYTAAMRRTHHEQRLAVVASGLDEFQQQLNTFLAGEQGRGIASSPATQLSPRKIAFVFSGQGGQWIGMGRELAEREPVFRARLEQCAEAMQPYTDWSLLDLLMATDDPQLLDQIDRVQPAIFAIQVAQAALWQSWGIQPDAVIGHSMGEVAAACVAGVLSLEDAAHIICRRSQLMKQVSGMGAMVLVELTYAEAEQVIATSGFAEQMGIAVSNGPTSTVLSGDPAALETVVTHLEAQGVFCRFVKVDVAAHSPHMDALRPQLVADVAQIVPQPGRVAVFSTVTGGYLAGEHFDADYWGRNLRQPVQFAAAVEQAVTQGFNTFVEIGPHPVLLAAIERGYGDQTELMTLASSRRDTAEQTMLLESLGQLYAAGCAVDWSALYPQQGQVIALPAYPWQRERFWYQESGRKSTSGSQSGHPLLGEGLGLFNGDHIWQIELDLAQLPYLRDHVVQGRVVFPAAGYSEMALAAAQLMLGLDQAGLRDMTFQEALFLVPEQPVLVQVSITTPTAGALRFEILSQQSERWVLHAFGIIEEQRVPAEVAVTSPPGRFEDGSAHYQNMQARGLAYGPDFQGIRSLAVADDTAVATIVSPYVGAAKYRLHPALWDASYQLLLATLPDADGDLYLPVSIGHVTLAHRPVNPDEVLQAQAHRTQWDETLLQGDVTLFDAQGHVLLHIEGLRMQRLQRRENTVDDLLYRVDWLPVQVADSSPATAGNWLIFADDSGLGVGLAAELQDAGGETTLVYAGEGYAQHPDGSFTVDPLQKADFEKLLQATPAHWQGLVFMWGLNTQPSEMAASAHRHTLATLYMVQALQAVNAVPRVWLVTRGAQSVSGSAVDPAQTSLWGFGAVLANEHPELHTVRCDLDPVSGDAADLAHLLRSAVDEDQLAVRERQIYAARLSATVSIAPKEAGSIQVVAAGEQPFRAEVVSPGVLDNLRLRAVSRQEPGPGEVEIEVVAVGLNFLNVMSALGIYPGYADGVGPLGIECAGRIAQVGEGVEQWQVGDEVVAIAFDSLATHAITDARLVARKPAHLSFEAVVTMPITFVTAYYSLYELARIQPDERVLIHAGAGGVGLAAIQLVQRAGAEAWATASSPEKREFLESLGVVFTGDSRSLSFADDIRQATDGEGVDVVLNSLSGEAITRGLELLRPFGRFVEIGKRDIYDNSRVGLLPFRNSLAYFAVDLDRMARERPGYVGAMLQDIMAMAEAGEITPLPTQIFPVGKLTDAFRHMAQGGHIGKIVIAIADQEAPVFIPAGSVIRQDSAYLITGGLGALGLTVAGWLAEQGAGQIVLAGRRAPDTATQTYINQLQATGAQIEVVQFDAADATATRQFIERIEQSLPLRGVFHAAGLLADSTLQQFDHAQFVRALLPKVDGAWNLHLATLGCDLDLFVLFSSVAAVLGIAGQANYAAGNAFMDGLAAYRHDLGLPALSINWGPWSEIGLAAVQDNRGSRLAQRGLGSIRPEVGMALLEQMLGESAHNILAMSFDPDTWIQAYAAAAQTSLLKDFKAQKPSPTSTAPDDLHTLIAQADSYTAKIAILEAHVREQVGLVLGMSASRVDLNKALQTMGLDSLMSLELRNRLESTLHLKLSATLVFNYPSVAAMTRNLAEKLHIHEAALPADEAQPLIDDTDDELQGLTAEEVEALLANELASLDDLLGGS